jgi:murein DD-endopeptidase MepM/ murein hydrolase activator NlpD
VEGGQVLGLVGNTGISSEPHLHFQVMDASGGSSALNADGLPYVFDRFTLVGNIPDLTAPALTPASPPPERTDQYLISGDVINVP